MRLIHPGALLNQNLQVVLLYQLFNMLTAMVAFFDDHFNKVEQQIQRVEEGRGALFNKLVLADNTFCSCPMLAVVFKCWKATQSPT